MSRLKLFLLGSPHIERDGVRVEAERRTVIALLAYLAVMEQPHSRDTLATLFWPDTDQAHARGALRRDISVLNKMLGGGRLAVEGQTVALQRSAGLWVDVAQFHSLLALCQTHGHPEVEVCPACFAPLTEAVSLYQDDFLAGFTLRQSPDFDDWQFFQTESLRRELASALERLVRGHSAQGEFEPAIGYARRWLALDPLHEPAHRALMQLYAWSGQRNAALRQYGECVRILERELGVSPEVATAQLYEAIKDNQAPPAADPHLTSRPEKSTRQDNLLYTPGRSVIGSATGYRSVASGDEPEPVLLELPFSPLDRVRRSRLVGRERELAEANELWQQAASASGEGRVLFVSGEPGIGKTRLVRELATSVEASGAKVLVSECYAEGGPPYAPIAQMLRAILGDTGEASFDLDLPSFVLADLITLAPDLRLHYPDVPPNPSLEAQAEQQRLFESVVAWYDALTQAVRVPLMLLVEDVHWADSGTLFLLRHLARRSRTRQTKLRLLLVMTYREAELNAVPALNEILLDLNRERLAEQIKLSHLNREQTHDLLAGMLATGGEISPEFLDGIYRETEGNPFFIEEVCKALIEDGKLYYFGGSWRRTDMAAIHLPQSVRGAILSRVEKLSTPVQETLRLAAVLGREFDFDTLQGASDLNEEALIIALERAERTQLIGEVQRAGQVTFAFTHALIPFTLRESVSGLRLQRLHRRVASVIEAQRPNNYEALAYHFAAAGQREQAVRYSRHAAQRAAAMYAYDVAAQHLQTALDLIEAGEQIELRMTLLEQLADATYLLGEHTRAIPPYQEALDLWRSLAGVDKMIAVRLHRKIIQRVTNLPRVADFQAFETVLQASLTEGLQLIEGAPPHVEIVRLLTALAPEPLMWRVRSSMDWAAAERYARTAVDMAEQLDVPAELAAALVALAAVYAARGLLSERVPIAHQILTLCRDPRFTDIRERMGALYEASIALVDAGEYRQALPYFQEAERLADQMRAVNEQVFALARQAQCWLRLDRWDEVLSTEEKLQAVKQRYPEFAERARTWCFYAALKAGVHALRGEFDLAATWREEATAIMVAINGPPEQWTRSQHY